MQDGYRNLIERQTRIPAWVRWIELLVICAVVLGLAWLARPEDPFFLGGPFPWPLLAPVLVALRYGFFAGFIAVALEALILVGVVQHLELNLATLPYSYLVGLAATTMLVGEFRDYWQRQIDVLKQSNAYRQIRLDEFTRNYHLLKVSHDRLEMQLAGSGQSLREALRHLQRQLQKADTATFTPQAAKSALDILAEYGSLQRAALLVVEGGILMPGPVAEIGGMTEVDLDDHLVHRCLEIRQLVSIRPELQGKKLDFDTRYLAVIPLLDSEETLRGLVVVQLMPFFAFEDKTLRLLAVLAGRIADFMHFHEMVPGEDDEDAIVFWANLKRALLDRVLYQVPGSLMLMRVTPSDEGERFIELVESIRRGLDLILIRQGDPVQVLVLLPLTDELGLAGYRQRLDDRVREVLGRTVLDLPVSLHRHTLSTEQALAAFLKEHGIHGQ